MKYAFCGGKLLDGTREMQPREGLVLRTDGDRITDIVPEGTDLTGYEVVNLKGGYLMPGLINMHVHLAGSGKPQKKQRDNEKLVKTILSTGLTRKVAYGMVAGFAKDELFSGVTTIRTVGGLADFDTRLRDDIRAGRRVGPRILAANEGISVPGGHMAGSVAVAAHTIDEALEQLEKGRQQGVDLVKLMITGGVLDAKEKGVLVCNVPTYGTACVGQYAIALLLEVCHHIGHHDKTVHEGKWANHIDWCYWDHSLIELDGKTAGIIGFGRIGQTTGRIAKALGMKVLAYDLYPNDSGKAIAEYVDLDTLLAQSDVVFLHCNLTADNEKMINKANIAKMKDGAILINNSRGQLIDEQDVTDALKSGKLGAAGLDVVYTEPIKADNPLLTAPNCIITPHMSWGSQGSRQRIMDCTVNNIRAFLSGAPENVVNP